MYFERYKASTGFLKCQTNCNDRVTILVDQREAVNIVYLNYSEAFDNVFLDKAGRTIPLQPYYFSR